MDDLYFRAALGAMKGFRRVLRILLKNISPQAVFERTTQKDLLGYGFKSEVAELFLLEKNRINPEREYKKVIMCHANILLPWDEEYPFLLQQLDAPPLFLYKRGSYQKDVEKRLQIAVVGSRNMNPYSREVLENLIPELANAGVVIVSGLAFGVDAKAHMETLKAGGRAVGVLGNGIDAVYPVENACLGKKILETGGVLFSEYAPGTVPEKYFFPARNRIIAGLSHGTLVIQAGEKSGALITASQALDANRDVFAIPGSALSPDHIGTNRLIADGARLVMSVQDILAVFRQNSETLGTRKKKQKLSEKEQSLLKAVSVGISHLTDLCGTLEISLQELNVLITSLEMKGLIRVEGEMVTEGGIL